MKICIPKEFVDEFKKKIEQYDITGASLRKMTSNERVAAIQKIIPDEAIAKKFVSEVEARMMSKNEDALNSFLEAQTEKSITTPMLAQKEMLRKAFKNTDILNTANSDDFLKQLASERMGLTMEKNEAQEIVKRSTEAEKLLKEIPKEGEASTEIINKRKLAYGYEAEGFDLYVKGLRAKEETPRLFDAIKGSEARLRFMREIKEEGVVKRVGSSIMREAAAVKGSVASLDLSFNLRQGYKTLLNHPTLWWKGVKNSTKTLVSASDKYAKKLMGEEEFNAAQKAMGEHAATENPYLFKIKAEIRGSDNAREGYYARAANGYGLNVGAEEIFAENMLAKAPVVGGFFRGSESAFSAGALTMRHQLADLFIEKAIANGYDPLADKVLADGLGELTGTMTGRSTMPQMLEKAVPLGNFLMFSPRFTASQFYTFIDPVMGGESLIRKAAGQTLSSANYVRRAKAVEALNVIGRAAALIGTIEAVGSAMGNPNIIDIHPSSKTFGFIKSPFGGDYFDLLGGQGQIISLVTQMKTGEKWDPTTGTYKQFNSLTGKASSILDDFITAKKSPASSVAVTLMNRQGFGGRPVGEELVRSVVMPIILSTVWDTANRDGAAEATMVLLGEFTGLSTKNYSVNLSGKDFKQLQSDKPKAYDAATQYVTQKSLDYARKMRDNQGFQKMSHDEQYKAATSAVNKIKKDALHKFGK